MSRAHSVLAAVGTVAVAIGMVFMIQPDLARHLTVPDIGVLMVGAIALVEGLRAVQTRRRSQIVGARPPDPEGGIEPLVPGDDFDRLVARWSAWRGHGRFTHADTQVYKRLRESAIQTVMHASGVPRSEAEARVDEGTWTDDPIAAGFIGQSRVPTAPWSVKLRGLIHAGSVSRFYVERTVDAIESAGQRR